MLLMLLLVSKHRNGTSEIKPEWDESRKAREEGENAKHRRWNKAILDVCHNEKLFWLSPSFEGVMGLPQSESEKIDRALALFSAMKRDNVPAALSDPIEKLLKL